MPVQQRVHVYPRGRTVVIGALLTLLTVGCAHSKAQTDEPELEASESEVAALRRDNALLRTRVQNLEERVRMIEHSGGAVASTSIGGSGYESYAVAADPDAWAEPESDGPRQLPVVKLTPQERSIDRRPAAQPTAAPVRQSGSISLSPVPNSGAPEYDDAYVVDARDDEGFEEAAPAEERGGEPASYRLVGSKLVQATMRKPSTSTRPSDRDSGVAKDYKDAMSMYDEARYADAEQAFAAIVTAHPNHDYADNALYWQGEAAYDQAHYADALAAFTKVVEKYGGGSKAPDALLKIGLCYGRLGDAANARDVLTQLVAAYPRADASKIAKRKLADLEN
jgi:tol-pal system protein YbgF